MSPPDSRVPKVVDWGTVGVDAIVGVLTSAFFFYLGQKVGKSKAADLGARLAQDDAEATYGRTVHRVRGKKRPKRLAKDYTGISLERDGPNTLAEVVGSAPWVRTVQVILGAVFLTLLGACLTAYWFVDWNLTSRAIISVDWLLYPWSHPPIDTLATLASWGSWVLLLLLIVEGILAYLRRRWRRWAFLHPVELRMYRDGRTAVVSEEIVQPNRAALFIGEHPGSSTLLAGALASLWYFTAPFLQSGGNLYLFDPAMVLEYYPGFLLVVMMGWMLVVWDASYLIGKDLETLAEHDQIVEELRRKYVELVPRGRRGKSSGLPAKADEDSPPFRPST